MCAAKKLLFCVFWNLLLWCCFHVEKTKKKTISKILYLDMLLASSNDESKDLPKKLFLGGKKKKFHLKRSELGESNSSNKNKTKVFFCKNRNISLYVKYSPFKYSSPFLSTVFSWLPPFALLEVTSLFFLSSRMWKSWFWKNISSFRKTTKNCIFVVFHFQRWMWKKFFRGSLISHFCQ